MEGTEQYIVFRRSENTNSFGLRQFFLMSKTGKAYKSCAGSIYDKQVGEKIYGTFSINEKTGNVSECRFTGHELTERLSEDAPEDVIKEVWLMEKQ